MIYIHIVIAVDVYIHIQPFIVKFMQKFSLGMLYGCERNNSIQFFKYNVCFMQHM
jgi:hypothetical protein